MNDVFLPGYAFALLAITHSPAPEQLELSGIFGDHMVLQSGTCTPLWGRAPAGSRWSVAIADREVSAVADDEGRWLVELEDLPPGGPHTLVCAGDGWVVKTIHDVWIGEVWLGAGQSNMALPVSHCDDLEQELADADHPTIRMFTPRTGPASEPAENITGEWVVCSRETLEDFSGTLYFFGREIDRQLGRPVGLINTSMGGSQIESWISIEAQLACSELREETLEDYYRYRNFNPERSRRTYEARVAAWEKAVAECEAVGEAVPMKPIDPIEKHRRLGIPGGLFNSYIAPIVPYAVRGVLWYQGEGNSGPGGVHRYQHQLPLLVQDWRRRWDRELPFAWVQLPNYSPPLGRADWPTLRDTMRRTLELPATGMAITIDIGETGDIHPSNKQDVGRRLAGWALGEVYGLDVVTSGPLPTTHTCEGATVIVHFEHTQGGLVSKDEELAGFEVLDRAGQWHTAEARIQGDCVHVTGEGVLEPVGVRYGWANDPVAPLQGGTGWPASPFALP